MNSAPIKSKKVFLLKNGPANNTIFVLGGTGKGKTSLIATLLLEVDSFVIFDAKNDYYPEYFGVEETQVVNNLHELAEALNGGFSKIIFRITSIDESSDELLDNALEYICQFQTAQLKAFPNAPSITISLDELNRFAETHSKTKWMGEIIERGRDYKIHKLFGAQWFNTIPTWMRASFSEIYTFDYKESVGLKRLADYGFDEEEVKNLPKHHCLHLGENGVEMIRLDGELKRATTEKQHEENQD